MMRRPVWLAAGVALGVGGTLWAEQRVRRTLRRAAQRLTPEHAAFQAKERAARTGQRLRAAVEEGRSTRARREAELWVELGGREGTERSRR